TVQMTHALIPPVRLNKPLSFLTAYRKKFPMVVYEITQWPSQTSLPQKTKLVGIFTNQKDLKRRRHLLQKYVVVAPTFKDGVLRFTHPHRQYSKWPYPSLAEVYKDKAGQVHSVVFYGNPDGEFLNKGYLVIRGQVCLGPDKISQEDPEYLFLEIGTWLEDMAQAPFLKGTPYAALWLKKQWQQSVDFMKQAEDVIGKTKGLFKQKKFRILRQVSDLIGGIPMEDNSSIADGIDGLISFLTGEKLSIESAFNITLNFPDKLQTELPQEVFADSLSRENASSSSSAVKGQGGLLAALKSYRDDISYWLFKLRFHRMLADPFTIKGKQSFLKNKMDDLFRALPCHGRTFFMKELYRNFHKRDKQVCHCSLYQGADRETANQYMTLPQTKQKIRDRYADQIEGREGMPYAIIDALYAHDPDCRVLIVEDLALWKKLVDYVPSGAIHVNSIGVNNRILCYMRFITPGLTHECLHGLFAHREVRRIYLLVEKWEVFEEILTLIYQLLWYPGKKQDGEFIYYRMNDDERSFFGHLDKLHRWELIEEFIDKYVKNFPGVREALGRIYKECGAPVPPDLRNASGSSGSSALERKIDRATGASFRMPRKAHEIKYRVHFDQSWIESQFASFAAKHPEFPFKEGLPDIEAVDPEPLEFEGAVFPDSWPVLSIVLGKIVRWMPGYIKAFCCEALMWFIFYTVWKNIQRINQDVENKIEAMSGYSLPDKESHFWLEIKFYGIDEWMVFDFSDFLRHFGKKYFIGRRSILKQPLPPYSEFDYNMGISLDGWKVEAVDPDKSISSSSGRFSSSSVISGRLGDLSKLYNRKPMAKKNG
ncbi:MAG: hypothetical protein MJA29_05535, partial [Candidatus Omnitrophica bacterium]|nr:hypothetical protein [Candidatus Omnitrophota bacterium]